MSQKESKLVRNSLNDIVPNNSNKAARGEEDSTDRKEVGDKKKLKPIVKKGNAIKKKKSVIAKFKESFLGESENLGDYIMYDVLVPAFRDTISDMGFGVIERLFGNGRSKHGRSSNVVRDRGRSYVSYNSQDNSRRGNRDRDDRRDVDKSSRARHNFENISFTHKWEAEEVLSHLVDMVLEYGEATVRAFCELSGLEAEYTDDRYGWTNLRDAYVDRTRDGFVIIFPETKPL